MRYSIVGQKHLNLDPHLTGILPERWSPSFASRQTALIRMPGPSSGSTASGSDTFRRPTRPSLRR